MQAGDIVFVNFSPTMGHEQSGERPALVVSDELFNKHSGFVWVIPITGKCKNLPMELSLPPGLTTKGVLLLSQPRAVDYRAMHTRKLESVSAEFLEDIRARLRAVIS